MAESAMGAIISLDEAVELIEDKDCILGTDSESKISEDDDPNFINHNSDRVSMFGNGKNLNCVFFAIYLIGFFTLVGIKQGMSG